MSMNKMKNKLHTAAAVCAVAASAVAMSVALAPAASAAPAAEKATPALVSNVRSICAQDLYVRAQPAGVIIGTLYYGENFDVYRYSPSGDWVYGHAYGNVHQDGWVQNGWFC